MAKLYNQDGYSIRRNPKIFVSGFNRIEMLLDLVESIDKQSTLIITATEPTVIHAKEGLKTLVVASQQDLEYAGTVLASDELQISKFGTKIETIVFDTWNELQEMFMNIRVAQENLDVPNYDCWSWLSKISASIFKEFNALDQTIIYLGVASPPSKEGEDVKPGCLGSASNNLSSSMDLNVFHSVCYNDQGERQPIFWTYPRQGMPWITDRSRLFETSNVKADWPRTFKALVTAYQENFRLLSAGGISADAPKSTVVQEAVAPSVAGMKSDSEINQALGL